jgi:hypothetical protein
MAKSMTVEELLPLVARLTPGERARLLRLIAASRDGIAAAAYAAIPPGADEFSSDENPLEWESSGWEEVD